MSSIDRKKHAEEMIAAIEKIQQNPCKSCINISLCYQGGSNEKKCTKIHSREEKERILNMK